MKKIIILLLIPFFTYSQYLPSDIQTFFNGLCCSNDTTSQQITICYYKTTTNENFTPQSSFPNKVNINGTLSFEETVFNNTYVTGNEADGQYSLRNGSNDLNGLTSSYAIAFNFSIQSNFTPYKIYSQKLIGTAGTTYKAGFWAKERASGVKANFTYIVKDGSNQIATGATGNMTNTYTNYKTNSFTMPSSGFVYIEIYNNVNGSASGNDPLLDGVGLALVNSTTTLYKKVTSNGIDTYYDSNNVVITGSALTQLQTDIANGTAIQTTCTF